MLKTVGIYHDIYTNAYQQELSPPFEPLPPVKPVTHTPLEVNDICIIPDIKRITQTYETVHTSPNAQTGDDVKLSHIL